MTNSISIPLSLFDISESDFSDIELGSIFRAVIKYVQTNEDSDFDDRCIRLAYQNIKKVIDTERDRYIEKCNKNRENIRKRWASKSDTTEYDRIQSNTTVYNRR